MRVLPTLVFSAALVATGCSSNGDVTTTGSTDRGRDDVSSDASGNGSGNGSGSANGRTSNERVLGGAGRFPQALVRFEDCDAFLDHVRSEARERVGPYGLQTDPWMWFGVDDVDGRLVGEEMTVEDLAAPDAGGGAVLEPASADTADGGDDGGDDGIDFGVDFTGTNVQELGIDEPDIIKTDGKRILVVSDNRLSHVDVSTGDPTLTDSILIPEGWGHEMFIRGDRALLFTNGGEWGYPMPIDIAVGDGDAEAEFATESTLDPFAPDRFGPATVVFEVDLSDPSDLRISASMRIEGQYLSARAIGDEVRLAVTSPPSQLPWLYPQNRNGEDRATDANRRVIDDSTIDDWLPSYELEADGVRTGGTLVSCDRAHHPAEFAGFDMISIVDLDLGAGLGDTFASDRTSTTGVLAAGQTVYSSLDRMYVATTQWASPEVVDGGDAVIERWNENFTTEIHAFAIAPDEPTRYVASGTLGGSLLDQFSLDEHDGFLRAITTEGSPWGGGNESETHLVVFEEQGDRLVAVGEVGGLGRGEQLHSARMIGERGYAVTFRQIDPFYVLDLSDPFHPRVTGELKIPGVSTYLHPVGEHHVLGIGQDATEQGATTGLKLSLFDVSDPADPREVDVWTMPNASSPVEWDHRAFQMWGDTAIVPVQSWNQEFNGAILFDLDDGIVETGRVSHVGDGVPNSDCRELTVDDVDEDTEFWWMIRDGYGHVQLCDAGDTGGWGGWYCDVIRLGDLQDWYGDPGATDAIVERLGADDDDRVEMCWPDGHQESIQRSLVVDDTLWTMTPRALQANELPSLDVEATIALR